MPDLLDVKTGLLQRLRERGDCPAGDLAAALACDRDDVSQALSELTKDGYRFEESQGSWRLSDSPDTPFPFEFPGRQNQVHYFPQTSSTMDKAREMAASGCAHLTVVVAGVQTKGRGRMDRTWASEAGGLYFTVVLRPESSPAEAIRYNFIASLALVKALRREGRIEATVKWPNDIMAGESKLSGLLSEMDADKDTINFINIGIGVNVNNDPSLIEPRAVSLRSLTGRPFSRTKILGLFLDYFEKGLAQEDFPGVIRQWKQFAGCLNREVTIVTLKEKLRGIAEGVNDQGALVLRLADGTIRAVCCGDCFYE